MFCGLSDRVKSFELCQNVSLCDFRFGIEGLDLTLIEVFSGFELPGNNFGTLGVSD